MKKTFFLIFAILMINGCKNAPSIDATEKTPIEGKTIVYYFHGKQRCITCLTLQDVTKQVVETTFSENNNVLFFEIDFSEPENAALAEKYEIVFSSLVIAKDDQFVDITDEAFALVKSNPDALKQRITEETMKLATL